MSDINHKLYTAAQVRGLDNAAIHEFDIAGYELMCRAGKAVLAAAGNDYPQAQHWLIVCGPGNNGGDGYVVARLAAAAGLNVTVCSVTDPDRLGGDAATAYQDWCSGGGQSTTGRTDSGRKDPGKDCSYDLIIDALLGTGIERDVEGDFRNAIDFINAASCPVIAIDIASGLNADTGCAMGAAVKAQLSVSFVGKKRGMFTADGGDHSGKVVFDDLAIPIEVAEQLADAQTVGELLSADFLTRVIKARANNSHKGTFGEVLAVGGASGMSGAILLCGEAALRSGAGKVRLATHPEHAAWVNLSRPELMVNAVNDGDQLQSSLKTPAVVALGPGLGRSDWSKSLLHACWQSHLNMVIDADALNLIAESGRHVLGRHVLGGRALGRHAVDGHSEDQLQDDNRPRAGRILTPHPAEAARLLGVTTADIQLDRVESAVALAKQYRAIVVLKGSGTVIARPDGAYAICPFGNPGMATAGSGDVLTGIIAALWAQGLGSWDATRAGVLAHALAGDLAAAQFGEMALVAGDITQQLHHVWQAATSDGK